MSTGKNINKTKGILEKLLFRLLHIQLGKKETKISLSFTVYFLPESSNIQVYTKLKKKEFWGGGNDLCRVKVLFYVYFTEEYKAH